MTQAAIRDMKINIIIPLVCHGHPISHLALTWHNAKKKKKLCTDLVSAHFLVQKGNEKVNEIPLKSPRRHLFRYDKNKTM